MAATSVFFIIGIVMGGLFGFILGYIWGGGTKNENNNMYTDLREKKGI